MTTRWILAEMMDALSAPGQRMKAAALVQFVLSAPGFVISAKSDELFARSLELYRQRPDKEWSLTDCISFVVMADEQIVEALTGDHHFEQAGFAALLK